MCTGHALTVLGGGVVLVHPRRIFWGEKIEKKNLETPLPPENWRPPWTIGDPPKKIGEPPRKIGDPPRDQTSPPVDRHTLVKILPWPNFVAAGKNLSLN